MAQHNESLQNSAWGVHRIAGATDAEVRGFFTAACEFVTEEAWHLLKCTKQRQFGLSLLEPGEEARTAGQPSGRAVPRLWDTVELHGLTSAAGQALNGQRGEVLPPRPPEGSADDERWHVRLFHDGRVVRSKAANLLVRDDLADEAVVKVCGADGGSFGIMVYASWAACWQVLTSDVSVFYLLTTNPLLVSHSLLYLLHHVLAAQPPGRARRRDGGAGLPTCRTAGRRRAILRGQRGV